MYHDTKKKPLPPITSSLPPLLLPPPPSKKEKKRNNSIKSSNNSLYRNERGKSFDSAIDLVNSPNSSTSTLFLPKYYYRHYNPHSISSKPLPSINYNPIRNITIIHVKKVRISFFYHYSLCTDSIYHI